MKNCFVCSKKLNSLNTPLRNMSKTKDEKVACTSCHRKISVKLNKTNFNDELSNNIIDNLDIYENTPKEKWYNNKGVLVLLLLVIPPLGIYGVFKRDSKTWKKIVSIFIGLFTSLILITIIWAILFPIDIVELGNNQFRKGNYSKAINEYSRIQQHDEQFALAQQRIKDARFKIDSINTSIRIIVEKHRLDSLAKNEAIKTFNIDYAKSVLKRWNNAYINDFRITSTNDSIVFKMMALATEGNWLKGAKLNERAHQRNYDSIFTSKFPKDSVVAKIIFSPNKKQLEKNQIIQERKSRIYKQFSNWDGKHRKLTEHIKNRMHDPDTFEHVSTSYTDKGSYINVYMTFRGSNKRGYKVLNKIKAKVSISGDVLSVKYL